MSNRDLDSEIAGRKILFRVEASRMCKGLEKRNPFLARVVQEVVELVPYDDVLPDEYAEAALLAADRVQRREGNVSDEQYQLVGEQVLVLCERAAGPAFRELAEQTAAFRLGFTPDEEQPVQRL